MKKLMLVAAAAAMTGVAQAKLCDVEAVGESCSVYNVKFTFKTLMAKKACAEGSKWLIRRLNNLNGIWYRTTTAEDNAAKAIAGAGNAVEPIDYLLGTGRVAFNRPVYWMDNATRKFEGILWQCEAACFEGAAPWNDVNVNFARINFAMWEKKSQVALTLPIAQFKIGKPVDGGNGFVNGEFRHEYATFDEEFNFTFLGRYGKSAQKVGAFWQPFIIGGQFIGAAGFGSYDAKNTRIKSVSGNAVGMIHPLNELGEDACGRRAPFFCAIGFMCAQWRDWCCDGCYAGLQLVPASGTWSLKYNASATKSANNGKTVLADLVPAYMLYSDARWAAQRDLDPILHSDNCYWLANEASADGLIPVGAVFYIDGGKTEKDVTLTAAINNAIAYQRDVFQVSEDGVYYEGDTEDNLPSGWVTESTVNADGTICLTLVKEFVTEAGKKTGSIALWKDEDGNIIVKTDKAGNVYRYEFVYLDIDNEGKVTTRDPELEEPEDDQGDDQGDDQV